MSIKDEYTAFCFNEACVNVMFRLQNGEVPCYVEVGNEEPKHYRNFEEFYNAYGG